MRGRRLPDNQPPENPGEYAFWMVQHPGFPVRYPYWMVVTPDGCRFMLHNENFLDSNGRYHQVEEHPDGTISVMPKPENFNSIMSPKGWHGYIDHGVWQQIE